MKSILAQQDVSDVSVETGSLAAFCQSTGIKPFPPHIWERQKKSHLWEVTEKHPMFDRWLCRKFPRELQKITQEYSVETAALIGVLIGVALLIAGLMLIGPPAAFWPTVSAIALAVTAFSFALCCLHLSKMWFRNRILYWIRMPGAVFFESFTSHPPVVASLFSQVSQACPDVKVVIEYDKLDPAFIVREPDG